MLPQAACNYALASVLNLSGNAFEDLVHREAGKPSRAHSTAVGSRQGCGEPRMLYTKGLLERLCHLFLLAHILRMAVECWWLRDCLGGMAGCVFVSWATHPARVVVDVKPCSTAAWTWEEIYSITFHNTKAFPFSPPASPVESRCKESSVWRSEWINGACGSFYCGICLCLHWVTYCTYCALKMADSSVHLQGFRKWIARLDLESLYTVLMCTRSGGKAFVVKRKEGFCLFLSFTFYFLLGIVCT